LKDLELVVSPHKRVLVVTLAESPAQFANVRSWFGEFLFLPVPQPMTVAIPPVATGKMS